MHSRARPATRTSRPGQHSRPDNDVLWTRALHHFQDGAPVLSQISLAVRDQEILAVTGPRGSGKTSLLRCLAGQLRPCEGELWFNSMPLHTLSTAALDQLRRERFGWVGSAPELVPELTVWENTALPLMLGGTSGRTARTQAVEWLERLDVGDRADSRPDALSLAQRQRVALARALVHGPTVLFADEPTAPLHRHDRALLLRTLAAAARSHGITVVLATHEEAVLPRPVWPRQSPPGGAGPPHGEPPLADRTVRLVDGRCTAVETVSAVEEQGAASCSPSV